MVGIPDVSSSDPKSHAKERSATSSAVSPILTRVLAHLGHVIDGTDRLQSSGRTEGYLDCVRRDVQWTILCAVCHVVGHLDATTTKFATFLLARSTVS